MVGGLGSATAPGFVCDEMSVVRRIDLAHDAFLLLVQELWAPEESAQLMRVLVEETDFEQREIVLFGRRVMQPRLVGWAGNLPYTYSGQTLEPRTGGPSLTRLFEVARKYAGQDFNHALFNFYRDGKDSMGRHSDDEPELGPSPVVVSFSFGAERRFVVAPKRGKEKPHSLSLPSGSLLVMGGSTQRHYRHGLPRQLGVTEPRLNVTLRKILGHSSAEAAH